MKVVLEAFNSANIRVSNSGDESKVYDIKANLGVSEKRINNVTDGEVKDGDAQLATYSRYNENNLNIQFKVTDVVVMCAIINAVNSFIADCEKAVENNEFNL